MILHELFFDGLGEQSEPATVLREALVRDFGSYERWRGEFVPWAKLSAGDPDADLVYAANGSVVDTTVVAGEVVMRNRQVADADEIAGEVRARARRLTGL